MTGRGAFGHIRRSVGSTSGRVVFRTLELLAAAAQRRHAPPLRVGVCPPIEKPLFCDGPVFLCTPCHLPEAEYENDHDTRRQDWASTWARSKQRGS